MQVQRRHMQEHFAHRHSRQLLQRVECTASFIVLGPPIVLGDAILKTIGAFVGNVQLNGSCTASAGRRLLDSTPLPTVSFHGE